MSLLRWLASPFVKMLVYGTASVEHIVGTTNKGNCVCGVIDPFGIWYLRDYTPDDMREYAWKLIAMADRVDAEKEFSC